MSVSSNNNPGDEKKNEDSSSFVDNDSSSKTKSSSPTKKAQDLIEKTLRGGKSFTDRDGVKKPYTRAVKRLFEEGDFSAPAISITVEKIKREEIGKLMRKYPDTNIYIAEEIKKMFEKGLFSDKNIPNVMGGSKNTPRQRGLRDLAYKVDPKASEAVKKLAGLELFADYFEELEQKAIENGRIAEKMAKKTQEEKGKATEDENNGEEAKIKAKEEEKGKLAKEKAEKEEEEERKKKEDKEDIEKKEDEENQASEDSKDVDNLGKNKAEEKNKGDSDESINYGSDTEENRDEKREAESEVIRKEAEDLKKSIPNFDDKVEAEKKKVREKEVTTLRERNEKESELVAAKEEFEQKYAGAKKAKSQTEKVAKFLATKEYIRKTNPNILNKIEEIKKIKDVDEKQRRNNKLNDLVKKEARLIIDQLDQGDKIETEKKEEKPTQQTNENVVEKNAEINDKDSVEKPKTEKANTINKYKTDQEEQNLNTAVSAMVDMIDSATESKELKSIKEDLEENAKDYPDSDNVKKALSILHNKEIEFERIETERANTINKYKTNQEEQNLNVIIMSINSQIDSVTDSKELKVVQGHLEEIAKDYPNDTRVQTALDNLHEKLKTRRVKDFNNKRNSVDSSAVSGIAGVATASVASGAVVSGVVGSVGIAGAGALASANGGSATPNTKIPQSKKSSAPKSPHLSSDRSAGSQQNNGMPLNNLENSFALKSKMEREGFSPAQSSRPSGSHPERTPLKPAKNRVSHLASPLASISENTTEPSHAQSPVSASEFPSTHKASSISAPKSAPVDISDPDNLEIPLVSQDIEQSFDENQGNQSKIQEMPSQDHPTSPASPQESSPRPLAPSDSISADDSLPIPSSPTPPQKPSSIPATHAPNSDPNNRDEPQESSESDSNLSKINFGAKPESQEATSTPKSSSKEKQLENEELEKGIEPKVREELTKLLKANAEKQAAGGDIDSGIEGSGAGGNVESDNRDSENQSGSSGGADTDMNNSSISPNSRGRNLKDIKDRAKALPENMRNLGRNARNIPEKTREIADNARKKAEALKKISKDDVKKAMALKKAALRKELALRKKNLKRNLKKKIKINAKYGKNPYMSCLFIIMMFLAFVNDFLLDIVVGLSLQVIGLIMTVSVVAAAIGAPLIVLVSAASKIIDAITGIILTIFSLITGGVTKASLNKHIFSITRLAIAVGVETIDVINLAPSWVIVIAINWMIMRRDATKAEEAQK